MKKNNLKKTFPILFFVICGIFWISEAQALTHVCSQNRQTPTAPDLFLSMANPLPFTEEYLKKGEVLYQNQSRPIACKVCHGINGDGKGDPDFESSPPARDFSCAKTMKTLSDGQLFWIIKNGSPNTSMFSFVTLSNEQVWQLIHYIRQFSK